MAVSSKIFIPTFISSINYEPVRTLPHIYFYNGLKDSEMFFIQHYPSGSDSVVNVDSSSAFPYFDYYDGVIPNPNSNSLLFFNELPAYGETPSGSLYTEYWETYVSLLYNPRTRLFKASAIIPLADYFEMELNDIVQWRGNYYHLRAINDYNLKDGTCNIELLGPIIRDAVSGGPTPIPPGPPETCVFEFSSSIQPSQLTLTGIIQETGSASTAWRTYFITSSNAISWSVDISSDGVSWTTKKTANISTISSTTIAFTGVNMAFISNDIPALPAFSSSYWRIVETQNDLTTKTTPVVNLNATNYWKVRGCDGVVGYTTSSNLDNPYYYGWGLDATAVYSKTDGINRTDCFGVLEYAGSGSYAITGNFYGYDVVNDTVFSTCTGCS